MPETVSLNFEIVQFTFSKTETLFFPLLLPEAIRFNLKKELFTDEFIKAISKKYLKNGEYLEILKLFPPLTLKEKTLKITIAKDKKTILYPDLDLDFQVFYCNLGEETSTLPPFKGVFGLVEKVSGNQASKNIKDCKYLGFVPVLGIESYGNSEAELENNLIENIKLEFARKKRLVSVNSILTTIWFENIKSISQTVNLDFYSLNELQEFQKGEKKSLLPIVAQLIPIDSNEKTFGLEYEKKQLSKALQGKYARSILLIGPSGIGKTSLIYDIYQHKSGLDSEKFWETTATQLIQKLTEGDGWQQNLAKVCLELRQNNNVLFIRSLTDMFETGQYQGNNVSMAEYLRKYIERGEITIITECTDEEAARIEILSPGYLSLFHTIHFEDAASKDLQDIINKKITLVAKKNNIEINENAIKEIIQLQQRYMPYSGFPGKTIRFLESIILNQKQNKIVIDKKQAIRYFCEETGLPDFMIDQSINLDLKKVENFFHTNIFGQEIAIETVINLLTAVKTGLNRSGKPIASLLFVGPTGVGKTEMAKVLAQFMFGDRQKMLRFDMSEYASPDAVLRLTGSSYYIEGILTSKVRQEPFSVVLFDELEKAHYSFFDLLLQILGEGRLTDSKGKVTDFCSTIIIMTSNIGAKSYQKDSFGFVQDKNYQQEAKKHFLKEVQNFFRPELFNRLDQIIPFLPLDKITVRNIVQREINNISKREGIKYRNITFEISDTALDYLAFKGYDPYYGARQMQRTLREDLLLPLAKKLNKYKIYLALISEITVADNALDISVKEVLADTKNPVVDKLIDENVLNIRRQSQYLEEGEYFIKLLSELDILEHKKRKEKNDFWKNIQASEKYTNYVRFKDNFLSCLKRIRDIETEIFIRRSATDNDISGLKLVFHECYKNYQDLKIELYQLITTQSDVCTMGIYGSQENIFKLLEMYQYLAAEKNYKTTVRSIWLRNNEDIFTVTNKTIKNLTHYDIHKDIIEGLNGLLNKDFTKEKFEEELAKLFIHKSDIELIMKYSATEYLKRDKLTPERESDRLLGLEIEFKGDIPFLYFKGEKDCHTFKKDSKDKNSIKYDIHTSNCKLAEFLTPENIHRKNYYDELKNQRIYAPNSLQDNEYKIQDNNCISYQDKLKEVLDRRFSDNLTSILINEEEAV